MDNGHDNAIHHHHHPGQQHASTSEEAAVSEETKRVRMANMTPDVIRTLSEIAGAHDPDNTLLSSSRNMEALSKKKKMWKDMLTSYLSSEVGHKAQMTMPQFKKAVYRVHKKRKPNLKLGGNNIANARLEAIKLKTEINLNLIKAHKLLEDPDRPLELLKISLSEDEKETVFLRHQSHMPVTVGSEGGGGEFHPPSETKYAAVVHQY